MARVRLAAYAALMVVLLLGARRRPPPSRSVPMRAAAAVGWPPSAGLVVAEVVTGGRLGLGRVRGAGERGRGARGSRRPRGRLRHQLRGDGHPEGGLDGVAAGRAGTPRPAGERARHLRGAGRRDLLRRARRHRWLDRAPADRRAPDRCRRLGRRHELVRRGFGCACAGGRPVDRARRDAGHERQRGRLLGRTRRPWRRGWHGSRARRRRPRPTPTPTHSRRLADAHRRPRRPRRPRPRTPTPSPDPTPTPTPRRPPRPRPTPTPTPTPTPDARPRRRPHAHADPDPDADPTPTPTPTATPVAHAEPNPTPTPTAVPATPISVARDLLDGTTVGRRGHPDHRPRGLESGRTGFVQDATAGIAVYLDAELAASGPRPGAACASSARWTRGTRSGRSA